MKLKQLLLGIDGVKVRGNQETVCTGIVSDSRIVAPGNLFLARSGEKHDGSLYIRQAMESGAAAVVTDLYDPFLKCPQIICKDPRRLEALLAARYYGHPSKDLFCVGVTGSKGKTTTSYLCRHLLEGFGQRCGLVGTIEAWTGNERFESAYTTHGAIANQKFLRQMLGAKCKSAVLEVSSHALTQERVSEIDFDAAIFTNLYPDHLDYHHSMEGYAKAKKKLISLAKTSILNADSPWSDFMQRKGPRITIGIDSPADLRAENISSTEFFVKGVRFSTALMGRFNVYNILLALALGLYLGKPLKEMSDILTTFPGVPGRLERVSGNVFVDFAHTGDSLAHALSTLRTLTKQRVIVVFGSGGDRDPKRREEMGLAAEKHADVSIITSDNPRSEDPQKITDEITRAYQVQNPQVILDRKEAIYRAIEIANPEDVVLIAGKGHEKVQIFLNQTVTFDDVAVVKEILGT